MGVPGAEIRSAAESVFRRESGRILAGLIRVLGSFDRAEEALQQAFASALEAWGESGVPSNPAAWITAAAQRKALDTLRRERTRRDKEESLRHHLEFHSAGAEPGEESMDIPDDRLRLIFTCCHPALSQEAQIALTLRTLGGLTTAEIAKALLVPEATLAQRLVRAKRKIQEARIPYEVPDPQRLGERLSAVRAVLYLIFNEGYAASTGSELMREGLCDEAIRLARMLLELMRAEPENNGLLALMLLHNSRRRARTRGGMLVTLEEQDRSLWERGDIAEGIALVEAALRAGRPGPYQLQAAIAALHAEAPTAGATDWRQIASLYDQLFEWNPSPVVALNRAVAAGMSAGYGSGLAQIDALADALDRYYLFHAARADFLRRLDRRSEAAAAYRRAIELATNPVERQYLGLRLASVADSA